MVVKQPKTLLKNIWKPVSMKLKFKYTERIVSIFLLAALCMIIFAVAFIVINKKYFESKAHFRAKLADANGLGMSTPIYFKGFKIGSITDFRLTPGNFIEADLEIYKEYRNKIVLNSALWKGLNPVTNASTLEFLQGPNPQELLPEGALIPSIAVPEGKYLLDNNYVKKAGDPLSTLLANLESFTEDITADSVKNKGAFFRALNNLAIASEDMKQIASKVNVLTTNLFKDKNPNDGTLFRLMNNLADLTEDFKTTNSMVKQTLRRADTMLIAFRNPDSLGLRMIDPTGEKLINPLRQTIAGFNSMIPELDNLVQYMNTRTSDMTIILDDLKLTLRQAQTTFETLNKFTTGNSGLPNEGPTTPSNVYSRPKPDDK